MSIMSLQAMKYMNDAIPYIKRILNKSTYTEEDIREIMKDEEKMNEFSIFMYGELPPHLKMKIKEKDFVNLMNEESKQQLKKTKNKRLVFGIKKGTKTAK